MGIMDFFAKKAEEAQRRAEEARRKAEEQAAAEKKLREEKEAIDTMCWVGICSDAAMMHSLRSIGAYDASIEKAEEVLHALDNLYYPGEEGEKKKRDVYGCIGRCLYAKADANDVGAMEKAWRYFKMADSISQEVIDVAIMALSTLRILDTQTDKEEYIYEKYSLAQSIYFTRKDELKDEQHIRLVFVSIIEENLIGKVCVQDKQWARKLAEEMLSLAPSLIDEYNRLSQYM